MQLRTPLPPVPRAYPAPAQDLDVSTAVQQRANAKAEKLQDLCSGKDVHVVFGTQAIATATAIELVYKVRVCVRC